ncbi:hypothetical protein Q8F55_002182 [Vanrija albida]|uniref:CUE domain-containing protein n=1 Tax=Vanrija albida TaxID=181172 RepID=A0ABR3Q966_9TREE
MTGFQHASVTKGIMILLGISSLAASLLDAKPYLHLQLVPHISKYHQFWRIFVHPFAFANSTELLMGELLLYQVGVGIERSFGSRKYASFIVVSTILSTFISATCIVFFHRFGLNAIPAGPYGIIFSILWQYFRTVPNLYSFRLLGIEFSYKIFTWILAAQLVLSHPPGSILAAASGTVTGYLYRTDTPFLLPSITRPRRLWRPLKAFRIPVSVHNLLARIFTPLLGQSPPPRRANRVLPGQVRDTPVADSTADATGGLRSLLAARAALGGVTATPRRTPTTAAAVNGDETESATPTGARAAMGEWVNEMTGRGTARAPTEQEIAALSNMFPNLSREAVVRALQRSDHNTALAVEALLEQSS